jgi:malonyl-CoA/methylmalonyl-CoA synthetase
VGTPILLPALHHPTDAVALRFGQHSVTYRELPVVAAALARRLSGATRVAIWATPQLETCLAVVAALMAGVPAVPINPRLGSREARHVVSDAGPDLVVATREAALPDSLRALPRVDVDLRAAADSLPPEPDPESPALIIYTSGTTGPPKGVVLPRRALVADLDALAAAWRWSAQDVLVHALPLFHVHGLVLGVLGPLRVGGALHHLGSFSVAGWPGNWPVPRRCCSRCRRCITGWRTRLSGIPRWPRRWEAPGCLSRAPLRCPCAITTGSWR